MKYYPVYSLLLIVLSACTMETYDYDTHDPARIKVMEETLEERNMSLDAELDEIRLEKRIPFPAER